MINVFDLQPGNRLELTDGRQVVVEENMEDGMWVSVRDEENDDVELAHAQDILRIAEG